VEIREKRRSEKNKREKKIKKGKREIEKKREG
jgi:hypothetical protein